jgi:hypothetical protein
MIAEKIESYPAVRCSQCNEPIPVPTRVLSLQNEIENRGTNLVFAFTVSCNTCESKEVYLFNEIQTFDGEPTKHRPKTRAACSTRREALWMS